MPNQHTPTPHNQQVGVVAVPLSGKQGAGLYAVVDAADLPLVQGHRWYVTRTPHSTYAHTTVTGSDGKQKTVKIHQLLLPDAPQVDHIDHDGLNNRRSNLRAATHAENRRNSRTNKNNTSGFKGVSWHKVSGKWRAKVGSHGSGTYVNLGLFETAEDAARAYDRAAEQEFGEFALTNAKMGLLP